MKVVRVLVYDGPTDWVISAMLHSVVAPDRPFSQDGGGTITEITRAEKVWEPNDAEMGVAQKHDRNLTRKLTVVPWAKP